jgi:hypothetical protein
MTPVLLATQAVRAGGSVIQPEVLASIQQASANTGVDFSYLMAQASRESSFDPSAQAPGGSASGLYQFVEQTWLGTFKEHGGDYGYADLAAKIVKQPDGHFAVTDPATRKQILGLRRDPQLNAGMAAELAADNKTKLQAALGRPVSATDLHLAHFLGLSGALRFIRKLAADPSATGASMFPRAAAANHSVFYTASGQARTIGDMYASMKSNMNSDQAAFASLDTTPASPTKPGGITAVASAATSATGTLQGFSNPGSILSPLMLITIAALPVAREEDNRVNGQRHGAIHSRATGGINPQINPAPVNPMSALGLG